MLLIILIFLVGAFYISMTSRHTKVIRIALASLIILTAIVLIANDKTNFGQKLNVKQTTASLTYLSAQRPLKVIYGQHHQIKKVVYRNQQQKKSVLAGTNLNIKLNQNKKQRLVIQTKTLAYKTNIEAIMFKGAKKNNLVTQKTYTFQVPSYWLKN